MKRIHDVRDPLVGVDLNLMLAFDALVRERSVTRAAQRLGLTQSALSHALKRLRELFGDALLVRGQGGMLLTPRAEALALPIRSALATLGRAVVEPVAFDPRTARRAFRLATPDLFDAVLIPRLLAQLGKEAPGLDLALSPPVLGRALERLETGELDFAVLVQPRGEEPLLGATGMMRRKLFSDDWVSYARKGHPALPKRGRLSLEAFAALSHIMVSPRGQGPGLVDAALARQRLTRRVALTLPHFASALPIVAASELVLTAPRALSRLAGPDIVVFAPPVALTPHHVHLVWHERFENDPGHLFLRECLFRIARTITTRGPGHEAV